MFDLKPTEQGRGTAGTLLFAFLLLLTATALGQQNPDFSGVYVMKSLTTSTSIVRAYPWKTLEGKTLLKVVQNGSALEVALTSDGKTITNTYVLGSESQNTEPDGTPTSDRAEMKGKTLVIHSSLHIKEWRPPGHSRPRHSKVVFVLGFEDTHNSRALPDWDGEDVNAG
jgi:hypothetical protein